MIQIYKKIKWFIKSLIKKIFGLFLHILIPRNKKYIIFNGMFGKNHEIFLHNTKYLFLYLTKQNDFHITWLCENNDMIKIFTKCGFKNIYSRRSLKGMYYALKSKYWFYDFLTTNLPLIYIQGATLINLWHGTGSLKKCMKDDKYTLNFSGLQQIIFDLFCPKDSFFNVDSEHEGKYRMRAFNAKEKQIVINGSPRLDVLYKDFDYQNLFMEEDYHNIKQLKENGKKLFFYVPTFRDTEENISGWLKSNMLNEFLIKYKYIYLII